MKKATALARSISIFVLLLYVKSAHSQEPELREYFNDMQTLLSDVDATKKSFKQSITSVSPGNVEIKVAEITAKGQELETTYELALADINGRQVRSFPSRDLFLVEIVAKGKQKLIKKTWDGGTKIAYVPDFKLYALDSDNGMDLAQAFKEAVPFAEEVEKNGFTLTSYDDYLNWLRDHITDVELAKANIEQALSVNPEKNTKVVLAQNRDARNTEQEFNLADLNSNSGEYHITKDEEIFIEFRTKRGVNSIKYSVNGAHKDYRDFIRIYANSLSEGKKLMHVFSAIVPMAETKAENAMPEISSESEIIRSFNERINRVVNVEGTISQQFALQDGEAVVTQQKTNGDKHVEHEYSFMLTDINARGIKSEAKKSEVFLELPVKNKQPYIKHFQNGTQQDYRHYIRLFFDSWEDVKVAQENLKTLIEEMEVEQEEAKKNSRITLPDAWENLEVAVKNVEAGDKRFEQKIEMVDIETSALRYSKRYTDPKRVRETIFEFGAKDPNPFTTEIHVSGPRVWVELVTRNKKKTVKVLEEGTLKNYHYVIEIEAESIANAKEIAENFNFLSKKYND